MGTEESNKPGTPYKFLVPQDETLNNPFLPHWTTMPAYYNSRSIQTPLLNPHATGSYLYHHMAPNQDASLAYSQIIHKAYGERNLDSNNVCAGNLQAERLTNKESQENGKKSSVRKNSRDGMSMKLLQDFSSSMNQQLNLVPGNDNSTVFNHNLGTNQNASSTNAELTKLEADQIRKERKRLSNRESAKRSRLRKQQECEELLQNIDTLKDENSSLTQNLKRLSEECLELSNENDSIQEELVNMYGPESIADILPMKPV